MKSTASMLKYLVILDGVLSYTIDTNHPVYHLRRGFKLVSAVGKMNDNKYLAIELIYMFLHWQSTDSI